MKRKPNETVPDDILAEAAEPAFRRIRALIDKAPPLYKGLLEDMERDLLDPDVKMAHLWKGRRLTPSGHTGRVGTLLGAPPWSFIRQLRIDVAASLLTDGRIREVTAGMIAFEAGFKSYNALNEAFKERFGVTANAYRKAHQSGASMTTDDWAGELTADGDELGADPALGPADAQEPVGPRFRGDVEDLADTIRAVLTRVERLTAQGELDSAFTALDHTDALIAAAHDVPDKLTAEVSARRAFVHHRRAEFRVRDLDLDEACTDLEKAHAAYDAAGELPRIICAVHERVTVSHDIREVLTEALCKRCATQLKTETGRTVREFLSQALEPVPRNLEWFQVCCDPCYRVVWDAIGKARLGLIDDAWKAFWMAAHADPVEEVPPSLARYVGALDEAEGMTHQEQRPRLELCKLAAATARELGDSLREAYALCFVGNALRAMGRFGEARATFLSASERCQENLWTAAFLAGMKGQLEAQAGHRQLALEGLRAAKALYSRLDPHTVGFVLIAQGELFFFETRYESAVQSLKEALIALDHRRDTVLAAGAVPINLAAALGASTHLEEANAVLKRCEFDRGRYRGLAAAELFVSGCLALDENRLKESLRLFRKATDFFESLDRLRDKALAIFYSVEAYVRLGNREKAIENAAEAISLFRTLACNQDTIDAFAKLRLLLEAAVTDAVTVAVTVRRLARAQGGWLSDPRMASRSSEGREAAAVISPKDQPRDRHRHGHLS